MGVVLLDPLCFSELAFSGIEDRAFLGIDPRSSGDGLHLVEGQRLSAVAARKVVEKVSQWPKRTALYESR